MFSDIKTRWLAPFSLRITAHIVPPPIDVDYVDITDVPITDPARMLPLESVHPFWVEDRCREEQFYKLFELVEKVSALIDGYERYLHIPVGLRRCAERWENQLSDIVWDAYSEMHAAVDNAMFVFDEKFHKAAWLLYEYHGCNNREFQSNLEEEAKAEYRTALREAFLQDIEKRSNPNHEQVEDLPF